jgi:hypothetical protein
MASKPTGAPTLGSEYAKSGPSRRQKAVSQVALLGAFVVSAGILTLSYEEYWVISPTALALRSLFNVEYELECFGYGFLAVGVLLFGVSWTLARSPNLRFSPGQSVFDRYHGNWGVGIGTLGYLVAAIGLFVVVLGDAGLLVGVPIIRFPVYYPLSEFIIGIGIAVWAIGAYVYRVSPS